jgi:hypothetical protein
MGALENTVLPLGRDQLTTDEILEFQWFFDRFL